MHTEDQHIGSGKKNIMSDGEPEEFLDLSVTGDDEIIELSGIAPDDSDDDSIIELSDIVQEDSDDDSIIELFDIAEKKQDGEDVVSVESMPEEDDSLITFDEFTSELEEESTDIPGVDFQDEDFSIDLDLNMDDTGDGFFSNNADVHDMPKKAAPDDEKLNNHDELPGTGTDNDAELFTSEQLESAIERVITKMFSEKIDRLLNAAIEKVVTGEIEKIRKELLDQGDMD